ncbi:hypothetical protein WICPIJ_008435 [Wickerhamomyces pijperi]|uniref:Uncharacterized protein n=1 Tax=Wickerhamomyces pijperi TaxID=599730 RepID=A0A9P8PYP0_WICPI|nr:hypothetical protein WICPIJ_008435 [Wickerhamomyces pijperi]
MTNSISSLNTLSSFLSAGLKFSKNCNNLSLFLAKISSTGFDFPGLAMKILNTLKLSTCRFLDLSLSKIITNFKFSGLST